jgi:hypothetical protein
MKKLVWLLLLTGTGCAIALFLNSFRFPGGNKLTAISSPRPSVASSPKVALSPSPSSSTAKKPTLYTRGQRVKAENMHLKVVGVKPLGKSLILSESEQLKALGTWKTVTVEVSNPDNSGNSLYATEFFLQDSDGKNYEYSREAANYYATLNAQRDSDNGDLTVSPNAEIPPATSVRFYLLFDVPDQAGNLKLMIKPLSESDSTAAVDLS